MSLDLSLQFDLVDVLVDPTTDTLLVTHDWRALDGRKNGILTTGSLMFEWRLIQRRGLSLDWRIVRGGRVVLLERGLSPIELPN